MNELVIWPRRLGKATAVKNKEALRELLKTQGWKVDSFNHLRKDIPHQAKDGTEITRTYRVKLQPPNCKVEVCVKGHWVKLTSAYYNDHVRFAVIDDACIRVGSMLFGDPKK